MVGMPLRAQAWAVSVRPRLIVCEGNVLDETTESVIATGQAKLMRADTQGTNKNAGNDV
jgi:acyl-coenzyme A thioesterase PaaI-like protein